MKLSEAIRLGSMVWPQGFDGWMDGEERCALAGAADASGCAGEFDLRFSRVGVPYSKLTELFPLLAVKLPYPMAHVNGGVLMLKVESIIVHLNDQKRWTRERIADWVEGVEAAQDSAPPASLAAVDPVATEHHEPTPRESSVFVTVTK